LEAGTGRKPRGLREVIAPLLTVRQVAERLGVCTATVYLLVDRGELAHVRVSNAIRVAPGDLSAYIAMAKRTAKRRQPAAPPSPLGR
jgi:excisionase family DNA binding protein